MTRPSRRAPVFIGIALVAVAAVAVLFLTSERDRASTLPAESGSASASAPAPAALAGPSETESGRGHARAAPEAVAEAFPPEYERALSGIVGRVVEPTGEPVAGAVVELVGGLVDLVTADVDQLLFDPDSFHVRFEMAKQTTGKDGRFRFARVDPRVWYLLGVNLGGLPRPQVRFVDRAPSPGETADLGDIALDPMVTLVGRVVDEAGRGVAGARVRATTLPGIVFQAGGGHVQPGTTILVRMGGRRESLRFAYKIPHWIDPLFEKLPFPAATTSGDGAFRLAGAPAGSLTLLVDGAGLPPAHQGPIPSGKAGVKEVGEVVVSRGDEIEGTVVDEKDHPVAGALVIVGIPSPLARQEVAFFGKPITAGPNGAFTAKGISSRHVVLAARAPDVAEWTIGDVVELEGEPLKIEVPAPRTAIVKVTDPAGKPLDAKVATQRAVEGLSLIPQLEPPIPARAEAVEPGTVRVRGLKTGKYNVYARAAGFAVGKADFEMTESGEPEVTVRLEPEIRVRAKVFGKADGKPVPLEAATVFAMSEKSGERMGYLALGSAKTNADGVASVSARGEGKVDVIATHPAYAPAKVEIQLPGTTEATIQLRVGGTIEGRVHRAGAPPDEPRMVIVRCEDDEVAQLPRTTVTDLEGRFRVQHLVPNARYQVVASAHLGNLMSLSPMQLMALEGESASAKCSVADEETTTVDIDLATSGRTPKPDDGFLRGRASVNGAAAEGDFASAQGNEWVRPKPIDASGAFDLGRVAPGTYVVSLTRGNRDFSNGFGGAIAAREVKVEAGATAYVEFAIQTGRLRGAVIDQDGKPIDRARVRVRPLGEKGKPIDAWGMGSRTDENGAFTVDELAAGSYRVSASTNEYPEATVPVEVPSGGAGPSIEIRLDGGIVVEGAVEIGDESGGSLWFRRKAAEGENPGSPVWINLEGSGHTFKTRRLKSGSYEVGLWAYGNEEIRFKPRQIDIPAEGLKGATLRFDRTTADDPDGRPPWMRSR
ncbi:MAG TPA: carboxypeptidase regulatory-like domain-containing protein [Planctomycetota bacterium]|nr:carboxypeptidase regulatory-like domain-containing protein [Planctomycetota bacterium]